MCFGRFQNNLNSLKELDKPGTGESVTLEFQSQAQTIHRSVVWGIGLGCLFFLPENGKQFAGLLSILPVFYLLGDDKKDGHCLTQDIFDKQSL